jgi:hypothetical protein
VNVLANWRFPWDRASHSPRRALPSAPQSWHSAASGAPILHLARDWLVAQGARPRPGPPGVLAARLLDGDTVTYTTDALYAREHPAARLLAPGTVGRDELLGAITSRASGTLRIPARDVNPTAIVRSAITLLDGRAAHGEDDQTHARCAACLEREGRIVIIGTGAVRDLRVERRSECTTIDAAVTISVRTHRGLREELARFAADAVSGDPLPPLDTTQLRTAEWHATPPTPQVAASDLERAKAGLAASVARTARAAGRLARVRSLADYHRRQADIMRTSERHLVEAPNEGRAILRARQGELDRLAAAHGVTVSSRVRAWNIIVEPRAEVRVGLRSGGALTVRVDLARQRIEAPRCLACAQPWRVGVRCAEGHVTCMNCHEICGHCGEGRCPQCAAPGMAACVACGEPTCARCARATARVRHPTAGAAHAARDASTASSPHAPQPAGGAHELTADDLDAMAPATWLAVVRWYLEAQGYRIQTEVTDVEAATVTFTCQAPHGSGDARALVVTPLGEAVPGGGDALQVRRLADERKRRRDVPLLVVTRLGASHVRRAYAVLPGVAVIDRDELLAYARRQAGAYGRAQAQAESETDARATAACAVQATLRGALLAAGEALASADRPVAVSQHATPSTIEGTEADARLLHQVLLACETLAEDWSNLFAATPTRADALAIEGNAASIGELANRATHLDTALRQATALWFSPAGRTPRATQHWRAALGEECALQCRLIASRLAAVDPAAWRDFDAAHPSGAVAAIAETQAAWQRAALRARRLRDECGVESVLVPLHPAPRA